MKPLKQFFSYLSFKNRYSFLFCLAFGIVALIHVNYNILRSLRNVLLVSCTSAGAELIAPVQLWGLLPLTFLMVYGISMLMRYFGQAKVFVVVSLLFLSYFTFHAFVIYPNRTWIESYMHFTFLKNHLPSLSLLLENWTAGIYFIAAELWKVAVLSVLFFGFLNRRVSFEEAKGLYSPILLGGSLGGLLAGPITVLCSSYHPSLFDKLSLDSWHTTFIMLTLAMVLVGGLAIGLFLILKNRTDLNQVEDTKEQRKKFSFLSSIKTFLTSKYLFSLSIIVIGDYIAYFLFEVFFLDLLKQALPDPNAYCLFNGKLTLWTSLLTLGSATLLTPLLLAKKNWKVAALITPCAIALSLMFFALVIFQKHPFIISLCHFFNLSSLQLAIGFGAMQFCVCRAMKNTLFDACKELAFIPLTEEMQSKGKLIVDGLAGRTGYCLAAGINQSLFSLFGSFQAGLPAAALISIGAVTLSIKSVMTISREVQKVPNRLQEA